MNNLMIAILLLIPSICAADEISFDFETGDLQGWQIMEGNFGLLISSREICRNHPGEKLNKQGRYFLGTLEMENDRYNDGFTGVIESPVFKLKSKEVSFLQGGGGHPDTYVSICTLDGIEQIISKGSNDERFTRIVLDTSKLAGKKVFIKITDMNRGGWGHVTFDDFRAEGIIDIEATASLRTDYEKQKKAIAERQKELKKIWAAESKRRLEKLTSDRYLFNKGKTRVYKSENLNAISIPIGGIGTGCIQMNGKAERSIWQIFGNFENVSLPNSFFAVRTETSDNSSVTRALQTESIESFLAIKSLEFKGEYPFARYYFKDDNLAADIRMEAFSPMIPLNAKDSSIPCAIFNLIAENNTEKTIRVDFLASQQNAVGYTGSEVYYGQSFKEYDRNINSIRTANGKASLSMSADIDHNTTAFGDMTLSVLSNGISGTADWDDIGQLYEDFNNDGKINGVKKSGPTVKGITLNGALTAGFELQPGDEKSIQFILTWNFPNSIHGAGVWNGSGNMYSNFWNDSEDSSNYVIQNIDDLTAKTHLYHDTLYASNLPHWLIDRISSQTAILRTKTCYWTKDNYFGGWEGCGSTDGCCLGNCTHVWHYAQSHARLYPEIARIMREQELNSVNEEGGLPHRQPSGFEPAADGQFGSILETYREFLISGDKEWFDRQWPTVKRMMEYAIETWDHDHDGVMSGRQWNTLDDALTGSSSWIGSFYLAALAACEKMAMIQNDNEFNELCSDIRLNGMTNQNSNLFNGEYYFQIPDEQLGKDYGPGCHIDQVLGQWWANQLGLGRIYPDERMKSALKSIFKYNFKPTFHGIIQVPRKFVHDDDAGTQMITWPKDGKPAPENLMFYGDEVMSGFEYSAAATMIQYGLLREGFATIRAIYDRYDGRLRTDLTKADTASWGYSGNPFGDDECGKFYARAMSIWSVLLAAQGFKYDGYAKIIGFNPAWKPDDHRSFFITGEGYGLFTQKRSSSKQTVKIEMKSGKLAIRCLESAFPDGITEPMIKIKLNKSEIRYSIKIASNLLYIDFTDEITLSAGDVLEMIIR